MRRRGLLGRRKLYFSGDAPPVVVAAPAPAPAAGPTDPIDTIVTSVQPWFYLIGDLGVTTVGSSVSAWADQSAELADATQGTGTAMPAHNATGLGTRGTVLFDGGTDVLNFSTLDLMAPGTNPIWFWMVIRQVTWTMNDSWYGGGGTTTTRLRQGGAGTPNVGANNTTTGPDCSGAAVDTWVRGEHLFNNATTDYVKMGSVSVTGTNTGNTNPALGAFCLGAHSAAAGGASNIEVALFAAFQGKPAAGEITALDAWVTDYYGGLVSL